MRLILLGPPGSGKGTQAKLLCRRLSLDHIGTGDIIRAAISHHTPVGERARPFVESGGLVPDTLVNDLVAEHFFQPGLHDRFVMDGYPRTLAQAKAFDQLLARKALPLDAVVLLDVGDDEIIRRVSGRWSCPKKGCKATYHTENNPPKLAGLCDDCGTGLVQRADDKPETVRERLVVYHRDTAELIPYYRQQGLLREIPGHGEIEEIYTSLSKILNPGPSGS
jgi:adenylate kinase